jgi:hypothetical protein
MKFSALHVILLSSVSFVASLSPTDAHSGTGIHPGDPEPPAPINEKEVFDELGDKVPEIDKIKAAPAAAAEGLSWWNSWFGGPESTGATSAYESNTDLIEVSDRSIWNSWSFDYLTYGLESIADASISGLGLLGSAGYTALEYTGAGLSELGEFATHPQTLDVVGGIAAATGSALITGTGIAATLAGTMGLALLSGSLEGLAPSNYYGYGYNNHNNHEDNSYDDHHHHDDYDNDI